MRLSKQIIKLVEDAQSGPLSEQELKKFWKDMQENIFKFSKRLVKEDLGIFYGSTEIEFSPVLVTGDFGRGGNDPDNDAELDKDFYKDPESSLKSVELKSFSPKEIVQMVLNEFTLDHESNEEEDNQAFQYFLKHFKNESVYFYGDALVEGYKPGSHGNSDAGEWEIKYEGTVKIKDFKYNENDEELEVSDYDILKLSVHDK